MTVFAIRAAALAAVSLFAAANAAAQTPAALTTTAKQIKYPAIATAAAGKVMREHNGVKVNGGGFGSALALDPKAPGYFYLLTDRGPNADSTDATKKVFPVPAFTPQIGRFKLEGNKLIQVGIIEIKGPDGKKISGLPNPDNGNTGEIAVDLEGKPLGTDPYGLDSEGLVALKDGTFWISDEYGPWLMHVDARGRMIERVGPFNGGGDVSAGGKSLPKVLAKRRANRGMESLTVTPDGKYLVGLMQNPVDNPDIAIRKTSKLNRLVFFDPKTGASWQYAYLMDETSSVVSEIAAVTNTTFIVSERDQLFAGDAKSPAKLKRVYKIDIAGASDISDPADTVNGKIVNGRTLEQLSDAQMKDAGIVPVAKELVVDLLALPGGYPHDKSEGLAVISDTLIAVSNDDDFGIIPDRKGGILSKKLPGMGNAVDVNRVYFIKLDKPLK